MCGGITQLLMQKQNLICFYFTWMENEQRIYMKEAEEIWYLLKDGQGILDRTAEGESTKLKSHFLVNTSKTSLFRDNVNTPRRSRANLGSSSYHTRAFNLCPRVMTILWLIFFTIYFLEEDPKTSNERYLFHFMTNHHNCTVMYRYSSWFKP